MNLDEKALRKFELLLRKPRTLVELIDLAGISRRTVFRYLAILEERGAFVWRVGITRPTKYQINAGAEDAGR